MNPEYEELDDTSVVTTEAERLNRLSYIRRVDYAEHSTPAKCVQRGQTTRLGGSGDRMLAGFEQGP